MGSFLVLWQDCYHPPHLLLNQEKQKKNKQQLKTIKNKKDNGKEKRIHVCV
jgi:hypothetical protein